VGGDASGGDGSATSGVGDGDASGVGVDGVMPDSRG
jgi:hypothetical protein